MISVCRDDGMVGVVMPHGVLFRGGSEAKIRQALLEEDLCEAVIGLPAGLFFGTGIPASVLIFNKSKPAERKGKVLFIDASSDGLYLEGKARNYLRMEDILRVTAVYDAWNEAGLSEEVIHDHVDKLAGQWTTAVAMHEERQLKAAAGQPADVIARITNEVAKQLEETDEAVQHVHHWLDAKDPDGEALPAMKRTPLEKFATIATHEEIAEENDYNLNISRYVDSTEPPPQLDVKAELRKLRKLEENRNDAEQRMNKLLEEVGYVF